MLIGGGGHPLDAVIDRIAVPGQSADVYFAVALHFSTQIGDAEAALIVLEHGIAYRRQYGVHQNREGNIRSIRVAWVIAYLDRADSKGLIHLIGSEACSIGSAHGRDQVINELLHLSALEHLGAEFCCGFAQDGVADLGNAEDSIHKVLKVTRVNPSMYLWIRIQRLLGQKICQLALIDN